MSEAAHSARAPELGTILLGTTKLTDEQLSEAREHLAENGGRLTDRLIAEGRPDGSCGGDERMVEGHRAAAAGDVLEMALATTNVSPRLSRMSRTSSTPSMVWTPSRPASICASVSLLKALIMRLTSNLSGATGYLKRPL